MPAINYELEVGGGLEQGFVRPEAGGQIEIRLSDAVQSRFRLDYSSPDILKLTAEGEFRLFKRGDAAIELGAGASATLLDGTKTYNGRVTWTISKEVALRATTEFGPDGNRVGASITLRF